MPCFTWWWLDPASWPGKNDGSELRRLDPVDDARSTMSAMPSTTASGSEPFPVASDQSFAAIDREISWPDARRR